MKNRIPEQTIGTANDNISERDFTTEKEAAEFFQQVKKRFFDINSWEFFAGEEKAEFSVTDENGNLLLDKPAVGNYLRIKIPGLHNPTGDTYDWVRVEVVEEESDEHTETAYIRVRPSENPQDKSGKIAHFYANTATSNFLIERNGTKITASVLGRNEIPNDDDLNVLEKVRNKIVAVGGIIAGSKFQWTSLVDGLLKKDEE